MLLKIDKEFLNICKAISDMNKTESEWAAFESSDMFQSEHYNGGYDGDEHAFCFSYYNETGFEFWFKLSLTEVILISDGNEIPIKLRPAD